MESEITDKIIQLEEELRQAMLSNDVEKLDKLIDDSLVFIGPDGSTATKQMDLDAHRQKLQVMTELSPSEQSIKIYDNFVTVTVRMKIIGNYGNFDISGQYRYLRIWTKINGSWKIVSGSVAQIK